MIKSKLMAIGTALAVTIGTIATAAPASAHGYGYERGDYYRGSYGDGYYNGGGYYRGGPAYGYNGGYNRGYNRGYYNDGYAYRDGRYNRDGYYRCRSDGTAGTVIGAIAGGLIGNGVAGRGDRTAGTLIGGALGGIAGNAIAKNGRC